MEGNPCNTILLHRMMPHVSTLGPYSRLCLWTQGCPRRCEGCITPEAQPLSGGYRVEFGEIESMLLRYPEQEGLTISGGEPFLQATALCHLIDRLRNKKDVGVIIYSGYTLNELQQSFAPKDSLSLLARTDLLIDGPYVQSLDDNGALRGSSNQQALLLTNRYKGEISRYGAGKKRETELRYSENGFCIIGVPKKSFPKEQML